MPLKIYCIDDEPALLELFVDTFSGADREITAFLDPQKAIDAIRLSPPDLLFLDYRLPNFTGDRLAQLLPSDIPKILITGDLQLKPAYPFFSVLVKPYQIEQVETIIQAFIQKKKVA